MVVYRHHGGETIALAALRSKASGRLRPVLDGPPHRQNVALHSRVVDIRVRPHLIEELFFGNQAVAMLDEV
jgi:hypothetical protein